MTAGGDVLPSSMNKKYEFTGVADALGLRQIRRLSDGQIGGWIQSESNLSQEGDCWVADCARVYGYAIVYGNAQVSSYAQVCGTASVSDEARVHGHAIVKDRAIVHGHADIEGAGIIGGFTKVS